MKHLFFIPILLFFISCGGGEKGPFFWKGEKDGRVLHILGTIHYGVNLEELKCSEEIEQSLSQSQLVWTEVNESLLTEVAYQLQKQAESDFIDSLGQDFKSLNPESQRFFQSKLPEGSFEGVNYLGLNHLYQELCNAQVISNYGGVPGEIKLDAQVQSLAQSQAISQANLDVADDLVEVNLTFGFPKELLSKESLERRIKYFDDNCSRAESVSAIKQAFKSGHLDSSSSDNWNKFKKQGWTDGELKIWKNYFETLIFKQRNETWLEKIISAHQQEANKEMFVAGGIAHFVGSYNVLDMLKKEGFTIKRYSAECVAEESY